MIPRSANPNDIDSPMVYEVDVPDEGEAAMPRGSDLTPAAQKLLSSLTDEPSTVVALVDRIAAAHGHGLKRETCSRELNRLAERGLADFIDQGPGRGRLWFTPSAEGVSDGV